MALSPGLIEQIVEWCNKSEALADARAKARSDFFGYDEPGAVHYIEGTDGISGRERRFLGWFVFNFKLPDGRYPGELAANALFKGTELGSVLKSIQNSRYAMAPVTSVMPGQGFYLELGKEEFEVRSPALSRIIQKGITVCLHILPDKRNQWAPGPGWLTMPIQLGPGIRAQMKEIQPSPIQVERFLQGRVRGGKDLPKTEYPRDKTLKTAVARMTRAAQSEGKKKLILSEEEWKSIVLSYMSRNDLNGFPEEIYKRLGPFKSGEDVNKWLALASNIWNTTPQPDRGGKTADKLFHERCGDDIALAKQEPLSELTDAHFYQSLGRLLDVIKFYYATFAMEDEDLRGYFEKFMSYWDRTEYAQDEILAGFAVEEYLWNFRLPGSNRLLLDCFLEQKGGGLPEELKPLLLNWRGAQLRCGRVVSDKDLLVLQDMDSGERIECFSLGKDGMREFRGSKGQMIVSYISPWSSDVHCLLGHYAMAHAKKHIAAEYQDLKHALNNITSKTQKYFAERSTRTK